MSQKEQARFDVYRAVTESIAAAIRAGAGRFVMPWHGSGSTIARPENAYTHMEYHGINVIALWAQAYLNGYPSGHWASYKQWKLAGGQVRQGERGATVVFFKQLGAAPDNDAPSRGRLVARASRVFNAAQVEGWEPPIPRPASDRVETQASVATFVAKTGVTVVHGASGAWYDVTRDLIAMPSVDRFIGSPTSTPSEAYQATLLHELVHWTGAEHRLARQLHNMTMVARAREELIAEIGSAFLCGDLGVANEPRPDHAAYVSHWLQLLQDDARALFTASRLATKAANYLHEFTSNDL